MKNYEPDRRRAAFGIASVALTAITIALLVVAPATMDARGDGAFILANAQAAKRTPVEVTITPARIEVVGVRESNVAWALSDDGKPNCKPES